MRALLLPLIVLAACAQQDAPPLMCAALVQGCMLDQTLSVKTDRTPSSLKPFALTVVAPGAKEVHVELHMQGMEMGLNRYRLVRQLAGDWRATIILPACVSGRRDWSMLIEVDGVRRTLAFQTQ